MRSIIIAIFILSVFLLAATGTATTPQSIEVTRNLTSVPLAFTENLGQWDEQVSFRANAGGATMWFTSDGAVYQFTRTITTNSVIASESRVARDERGNLMGNSGRQTPSSAPDMMDRQPDSIESITIKASFIGANPNPQMVGLGEMEYKCNYFIGNDPNEWHTDVPNYNAIVYEDIYSGIDLKYYGNGKHMEYDFIVSPGADYSQIQIQYEGAESISINDNGELVVETKWGEVVEQRPIIYQTDNKTRIAVAGEYRLKGANSFGFDLSNYDPTLLLVIDPTLVYSTYLGGSSDDWGFGPAVDASGAAYVMGHTQSTDFPTIDPYQPGHPGAYDAFVTKLSSSGNSLVYSTYLGGSGDDYGYGIAVDGSGSAYVTGSTGSTDFPTQNPYQTFQGGTDDVFVTKLSSSGNSLVYSTYLGGSGSDRGFGIAVDGSGSAYVTGETNSSDFPTQNPYQGTYQGYMDVFVTKLSSSGNSLVYSTYLGGSDIDRGRGISVDGSGSAYVTGKTYSPDFPTQNPYQTDQGYNDVFVTKLSSSGNSLVYSTYLGGSGDEIGWGIAVDGSGSAYVTGETNSSDFPTQNPYQADQGGRDAFVTKLSSSGNSLVYSTYLGGNNEDDLGYGIAVDTSGSAYVTGFTYSTDFPTQNPYQGTYQGNRDVFVTKLSSSGNSLVYSTYLGGSGNDRGFGIAVDGSGSAYVTGETYSTDFPTQNPYQGTYQGDMDVFVCKINDSAGPPPSGADFSGSPRSGTYPLTVHFTDLSTNNPTAWNWHFGDGAHTSTSQNPTYTYTAAGTYTVRLIATGPNGADTATKIGYVTVTRTPYTFWRFAYRGSADGAEAWVWGTIDDVRQPPHLFHSMVNVGQVYFGIVPWWANDLDIVFHWSHTCANVTYSKVIALDYDGGWKFEYLRNWLIVHVGKERLELSLPTIGDSTGTIQHVYTVINLVEWLAEPKSLQDEYIIVDGECPELPGYLVGTTPIVFDSLAGPEENPLSTTPLTGTLYRDGQASAYVDTSCCIPPMRGNVDYDLGDAIDISDLVYLVDYMFNSGPEPPCIDEADITGAGGIDISDLVHLVDYMFNGGPPPVTCP